MLGAIMRNLKDIGAFPGSLILGALRLRSGGGVLHAGLVDPLGSDCAEGR